ncbi:phosphotransferase [Tunturiibacter empetritectus]|uniref:Aminoglycoside phosphotransferase domain-containing protein n=1 Tax=Tunturiibacter lichenicola TaxID=2051959 RepID=A0A852VMT3_9BACT|nr:phosphotransferase [Edaphobacter lichenicola]NYF91385.1 hypothetical protein [Edaphobacter lichenicola]
MSIAEATIEMIEYRVILVRSDSRQLLAFDAVGGYCLPRVRIPLFTRPAEQLQKAIKAIVGLPVIILEFLAVENGCCRCAVAEVLAPDASSELRPVTLEKIAGAELSEQERAQLDSLLSGTSHSAVSQIGWIDQAIGWLEWETAAKLSSKSQIEQYNAGGAFSLIRFPMDDATNYWLKATGEPNIHELPITKHLSELSGDCLPHFVSVRPEWNAWLMSGGPQVEEVTTEPYKLFCFLEGAAGSIAELQMRTQGHSQTLMDSGVFDQGFDVFQMHSEALFDSLEEAMSLQTSSRVPRLERSRLQEIRKIFDDVCSRMERLDLPKTIVHGDINYGNILFRCGRCQFIDWCEAYIANPLISLQHLLLLNKTKDPELRGFMSRGITDRYRTIWLRSCNAGSFDKGLIYMPLLAVASTLYGRGDWLTSPQRIDPRRQSYARSLARHMDNAAREPKLLEALCH